MVVRTARGPVLLVWYSLCTLSKRVDFGKLYSYDARFRLMLLVLTRPATFSISYFLSFFSGPNLTAHSVELLSMNKRTKHTCCFFNSVLHNSQVNPFFLNQDSKQK